MVKSGLGSQHSDAFPIRLHNPATMVTMEPLSVTQCLLWAGCCATCFRVTLPFNLPLALDKGKDTFISCNLPTERPQIISHYADDSA